MKRFCLFLLMLPMLLAARSYNLDELIQHGLDNSWTMQRSRLSYESSESQLSSAKWNLLPDATLGMEVRENLHNTNSAVSDLSSSFGLTISKGISLNDPDWFNYRYASLDQQKAKLTQQRNASAYAYEVFRAYLEVLSAQKQLGSLSENLAIQTRVWEQSKVLRQLGKNTDFDVKQNEIAVMNSRIQIMKLENTIRSNREKLFGLVQMTDEGLELDDLLPQEDFVMPEIVVDNSAEIKLLQADIRKAELSKKQDFLNYFPRLSLSYNFSRSVGGEDFEFDKYTTSHSIALNMSYSLWNHFTQSQSAKRSKINLRMAELSMRDKADEIQRQYQNQTQELDYLIRLDELYTEKLAQSTQQIRIAEERYRLGLIELLELDKTRNDYIDASIAFHSNRYQMIAAQQALNYLLSQKIMGKW